MIQWRKNNVREGSRICLGTCITRGGACSTDVIVVLVGVVLVEVIVVGEAARPRQSNIQRSINRRGCRCVLSGGSSCSVFDEE